MSEVFAIYPIDKSSNSSTKFLDRINSFEMRNLGKNRHCYKVHFSNQDYENCIKMAKREHFIFYMGHGGPTKLHGACGKNGELQNIDSLAMEENPQFYRNEDFITTNNISEFKDCIFSVFLVIPIKIKLNVLDVSQYRLV